MDKQSQYETIVFEVQEGVGIIRIDRPARLNAMNPRFFLELNALLDEIALDDSVKVVILTGGDKCFSAGADLKDERPPSFLQDAVRLMNRIERYPKPTIAAICGVAMGGGCELALACDLRIAAENARIAVPEIKIGIIPAAGGTQRLPRLIGVTRAKELLMTGDEINGVEAARIGLVNKAVPQAQVLDEAIKLAAVLAARSPLALRVAKDCVNVGMQMDVLSGIEYEAKGVALLRYSEDHQEGVKAFLERRRPTFVGR